MLGLCLTTSSMNTTLDNIWCYDLIFDLNFDYALLVNFNIKLLIISVFRFFDTNNVLISLTH